MSRGMVSAVGAAMTRTAVAAAIIGVVATGVTVPANAMPGTPVPLDVPTGPNDPACATMPWFAACLGGPYAANVGAPNVPNPQHPAPTGPSDPLCQSMPGDGVCAGGPYALPTIPPAAPQAATAPPPDAPPPNAPPAPPPDAAAPNAPLAPPPDAPIAPPPTAPHIDDMGGMHDFGGGRR
jgi:hypothetical protein